MEVRDFGMGPVTINPDKEYTPDPMGKQDLINKNGILVVGTNSEGAHGGGAARFAYDHLGLPWGQAEGIGGLACGLVTLKFGMTKHLIEQKGSPLMSDEELLESFKRFVETAKANPDKKFYLTKVGCGIANYSVEFMRSVYKQAIELYGEGVNNIIIPVEFE